MRALVAKENLFKSTCILRGKVPKYVTTILMSFLVYVYLASLVDGDRGPV